MDTRAASGHFFVIYIVLIIGVSSIELKKSFRSSVPTASTGLVTEASVIASLQRRLTKSDKKNSEGFEDRSSTADDVEGTPPEHIVPHSDNENSKESSTLSKYTGPSGRSASPPQIQLDFVPTKLYAQVRKTHTVKHLPRGEALKNAANEEEALAASRLRAVVSKSKTNTVYEEEGYEDAAYDHGGHIRDADFHEGYARKLEDERSLRQNGAGKNSGNEAESESTSDAAEELDDYENDYRDHASTIVSEWRDKKDGNDKDGKKYSGLGNLLKDPSLNPKQVTENEIEKLEHDLEREYEESERRTETKVPENLKKPPSDDDEEGNFSSEVDPAWSRRRQENADKNNNEPEEASSEPSEHSSSIGSEEEELLGTVSPSEPEETQDVPASVIPSANYGKIFWGYFQSVQSDRQPPTLSSPKEVRTNAKSPDGSPAEESTSVRNFTTAPTTLAKLDFQSNLSTPRYSDFSTPKNKDTALPSAGSLYESWKRRDHYKNSEESPGTHFEPSGSYVAQDEDVEDYPEDYEKNQSLKLQNVGSTTTLIGPKKLSYTVIIRPSQQPVLKSPPCDHEDYRTTGEETPILGLIPTKLSNDLRDQVSPDAVKDYSYANDFTAVRSPSLVPTFRQVTYGDFLPDSYANVARPSVTREIGTTGEEINNDNHDHYELVKNPYSNRPHPRFHRFRGRKKNPHNLIPVTKLVPPSPINKSKYSDYLGVRRIEKPVKRVDTSLSFSPWSDIMRFYRSINRNIFGRKKRSLGEGKIEERNISSSADGKLAGRIIGVSEAKKLRQERNFPGAPNRLAGSDRVSLEKMLGSGTRKRRSDEKLLHIAPMVVAEVIDGEIESRFNDGDPDEKDNENETRGKIEIEVPHFNFSDDIENTGEQKVIATPAVKKPFLDRIKYPFYADPNIPRSSALKYITNPRTVPRKTLGGTEFYDSRDRYRECDEVVPDVESALPEEEEPSGDREPRGDQPRLRGLGDRLDCFRAKYFDDDPLDNPLFLERDVGQPRVPEELDPGKIVSGILTEPHHDEEHRVVRRVSRKPELAGNADHHGHSLKNQSSQNESQDNRSFRKDEGTQRQQRFRGGGAVAGRRRRRKKILPPTTNAPIVSVTPYQREVYEDVMGTIKNLAGLYQTFGEPPLSPSVQSRFNHAPPTSGEKITDRQPVHITEKPRDTVIQGLLPPQPKESPKLGRYRIIPYRTNRVSYRTRARTETPPGEDGVKVGYFRTVTVHKRSIDDETISSDLSLAESRNFATSLINNATNNVTRVPAASGRIIYTIRDRIRHSKPRGIPGKHGKFTNLETSASEDVRRREPRYNRIIRKKVPPPDDETTTTLQPETFESHSEKPVTPAKILTSSGNSSGSNGYYDVPDEVYKIQYSTTRGKQIVPNVHEGGGIHEGSGVSEGKDHSNEGEVDKKKRGRKYDVRENPEDEVTTVSPAVEPTRAPEFLALHKYLESDPPGYSEASDEKSNESSQRYSEDEKPKQRYRIAEAKGETEEDVEEEKEDEESDEERQVERPLAQDDEESSSKSTEHNDSYRKSGAYRNSDGDETKEAEEDEDDEEEEGRDDETHSPQNEDERISQVEDAESEFERFASRPFSPFESYDDPKYKDLGPRLSKPSFYHPTFSSVSNREKNKYSAEKEESEESDEESSRYVFPWEADSADDEKVVEESDEKPHKISRYEYPWERRERLARERRRAAKKRKKYERLFSFGDDEEDDDDDDDASRTRHHERYQWPWERYSVPSKRHRPAKAARRNTDNEGTSSDYQPRFSSRYKTKNFHPKAANDPVAKSGVGTREKKIPVMSSMEEAPRDNPNKRTKTPKNVLRSNSTSEVTTPSTSTPLVFTVASRRSQKQNIVKTATSTTPPANNPTGTNRRLRIWRAFTNATKPTVSRNRKDNFANKGLAESGSQKTEVIANPNYSTSSGAARKIRRRRPSAELSSPGTTTTTRSPLRRRTPKRTPIHGGTMPANEEPTPKSIVESSTTPKLKTIEHRSRISKEEIITKTSYPGFNNSSYNGDEQIVETGNDTDASDTRGGEVNKSVKTISIMTKETPDRIYRTEKVNKDGVKGMVVSITPNNRTNSSLSSLGDFDDRSIDSEEERKMLEDFEASEQNGDEEDPEDSFTRDNPLILNLLMQVPPRKNRLTFDGTSNESDQSSEAEGSGSTDDDEHHREHDTRIEIRTNYVKNPNHRLYYYVEDE